MLDVTRQMALANSLQKLLHILGFPAHEHLDASIRMVLHPAGDLVSFGQREDRGTEADPLYLPLIECADRDHPSFRG